MLVAYGADFTPNDLDVTPALDEANLQRLGLLLDELGAIPAHHADWAASLSVAECQKALRTPPAPTGLQHLVDIRHRQDRV